MGNYVYVIGAGYSRSSYPDFTTYTKFYQNFGYSFEVGRTITGDASEIHKGSPLTNDLLKDALALKIDQITINQEEKSTFIKSRRIVKSWLDSLALTDIDSVRIQDVLTYLDMKISKEDENRRELSKIKFAMANILSILLYARLGHGTQQLDLEFVNYLKNKLDNLALQGNTDSEIIIINLNWDLVIDNALKQVFGTSLYEIDAKQGEFLDRTVFTSKNYAPDSSIRIKLIKPHGSLNWLWCLGCQELIIFEGDEITRYILPFNDDPEQITCRKCEKNELEPVLITPSLYRNIFSPLDGYTSSYQKMIAKIWEDLRTNLNDIIHLSIIGYSLPAEDKELRYHLREVILQSKNFKGMTIVTGSPKKSPTNQEIITGSHVAEMQQHYAWNEYVSFFGSKLLDSVYNTNYLNFWTFGFFEYFRRFVDEKSILHAEEGLTELIRTLDF